MTKAYSYLRFSTPEQSKGDSFRRQMEGSRAYAKRHGLDLDESTYKDLGMSAFRGKNAIEGALGAFLKAVETGKIRKGVYLLVENLDRLSRDTVQRAFRLFCDILDSGVTLVTLTDNKVFTAASINENPADLMMTLMSMYRAHEESFLKSKRISASWKAKRDKAQADGKKLTARCPAWLTLASDRKSFVADTARKKVVRRIFDLTIAGHGKAVIARRFNADSVPTFSDTSNGWHPSYIQKILESEAVCGVFQPMKIEVKDSKKTRIAAGEPIPDYFPAIVDRATFEKARRSRASRRIPPGRTGKDFSNLFTGLAVCGNCGAPMHFVNKGARGGPYLVCSNARREVANCKARGWKYGPVEALLILCIEKMDFGQLFPDLTRDTRAKLRELEDMKLETESELTQASKRLENILDAFEQNSKQPALMARLTTTQATTDKLSATLAALETQIEEEGERAKNAESDFRRVQDGLGRLDKAHKTAGPDLYDLRSRLHQLLKRTLSAITLHSDTSRYFTPENPDEWPGRIEIEFQSTKIGRVLYVAKKFRECRSAPMSDGKPDIKKGVTLKMRA